MARAAIAVLSFGGRAFQAAGGSPRDQARLVKRAARAVVTLVREGYRVVVVHGDEDELGRELTRNEESATKLPSEPIDQCIAATQGRTGSALDLEIRNELKRLQMTWSVSTLITHALVGLDDTAFQEPTRTLGPYLSDWRAKMLKRTGEARLVEEVGRGWRRTLPSPRPIEVVNLDAIEGLLEAGHIVIAGGGGGVPVAVDARGQLIGVEAVIPRDRTAALLAGDLGAELLVLLTSADQLFAHFGRTEQRPLERISTAELRKLRNDGHFPPDSVGSKVEAALEFVDDGGAAAIITSADKLAAALADRAGTRVAKHVTEGPIRRQISLFPMEEVDH